MKSAMTNTLIAVIFIVAFSSCTQKPSSMGGGSSDASSLVGGSPSGSSGSSASDAAKIAQVNSEKDLQTLLDNNNISLRDALLGLQNEIDTVRTNLATFETQTNNSIAALKAQDATLQQNITNASNSLTAKMNSMNSDLTQAITGVANTAQANLTAAVSTLTNNMNSAIATVNAATDQKIAAALTQANQFTTAQVAAAVTQLQGQSAAAQASILQQLGATNATVAAVQAITTSQGQQLANLGSNIADLANRVTNLETSQQVAQSSATTQQLLTQISNETAVLSFINDAQNGNFVANASGFVDTTVDPSLLNYEAAANTLIGSTTYTFDAPFKAAMVALYNQLQGETSSDTVIAEWNSVLTADNSALVTAETSGTAYPDFPHRLIGVFEAVAKLQGDYVNYKARVDALLGGAAQPNSYTQVQTLYSSYGSKLQGVISDYNNTIAGNKSLVTSRDAMVSAMNTQISGLDSQIQALTNNMDSQIASLRGDMNTAINNVSASLQADYNAKLNDQAQTIANLTIQQANLQSCFNNAQVATQVTNLIQAMTEMETSFFATLNPVKMSAAIQARDPSCASYFCEDKYGQEFRTRISLIPTAATDCQYQANATFANALGEDAAAFLARAFSDITLTGNPTYSLSNATLEAQRSAQNQTWNSIQTQNPLYAAIINRLIATAPAGAIPACGTTINGWVTDVFKTPTLSLLGDNTQMLDDVANSSDLQAKRNSVLTLATQVQQLISANASALTCGSIPNATPAIIADNIVNSVLNQAQLTNSQTALNDFINTAASIASQQLTGAQQQQLINNINTNLQTVNSTVSNLNNVVSTNVANNTAALQNQVDNITRVLNDVLTTLGMTDDQNWLYQNVACSNGNCISLPITGLTPTQPASIQKIQHFFDPSLYALANADGAATNVPSMTVCSGQTIDIGFTTGQGIGGPCWLNFRTTPVQAALYNAPNLLTFRLFGAADAVQIKGSIIGVNGNFNMVRSVAVPSVADVSGGNASGFAATAQTATNNLAQWLGAGIEDNALTDNVNYRTGDRRAGGAIDFTMPDLVQQEASINVGTPPSIVNTTLTFTPWRTLNLTGNNFQSGNSVNYTLYMYSPLVLDFSSAGRFHTMSQLRGVKFDIDGSGKPTNTGWVDGYNGGFLVLDLDNNGRIDSGRKLFGQATKLPNGELAQNGFEALAQYDTKHTGVINESNPIFNKLRIWFDYNADGISQSNELVTLKDAGVTEISLNYSEVTDYYKVDSGNLLKYKASFKGPKTCPNGVCKIYDVYFGGSKEIATNP